MKSQTVTKVVLSVVAAVTVVLAAVTLIGGGVLRSDSLPSETIPWGRLIGEFVDILAFETLIFLAERFAIKEPVSEKWLYCANLLCVPILLYGVIGWTIDLFTASYYNATITANLITTAFFLALRITSTFIIAKYVQKTQKTGDGSMS